MQEFYQTKDKGFIGERDAWRHTRDIQAANTEKGVEMNVGYGTNVDDTYLVREFPSMELDDPLYCAYAAEVYLYGCEEKMQAILQRMKKLDTNHADKDMILEMQRVQALLDAAYLDTDYFQHY